MLIRSASADTRAVRADVPSNGAAELDPLARDEPPLRDVRDDRVHAERYLWTVNSGPHSSFPWIARPHDVTALTEFELLERNFRGWVAAEISQHSPIFAVMDGGYPVSICFCARNTESSAEAGVETAGAFRGRGFAPFVTAAWVLAIRASERVPLYSTSWRNKACWRSLGSWAHSLCERLESRP